MIKEESLGEKIKKFRLRGNISQFQLELMTGTAQGVISRIESDKINPTKETIHKISDALELSKFERADLLDIDIKEEYFPLDRSFLYDEFITGIKIRDFIQDIELNNFQFVSGIENFRQACDQSSTLCNQDIMFISNLTAWRKYYPEDYGKEKYIPKRVHNNLFLKILLVNDDNAKRFKDEDKELYRQTKFFCNKPKLESTILITTESITIFNTKSQAEALMINNITATSRLKQAFSQVWNAAL